MHRIRSVLWRYRWLVVAACLGCAVWLTIGQFRPAPQAMTSVLVAARDVPAGVTLTAADVQLIQLPQAPSGAVTTEVAVGSTLTIGAPAGLPIVDTMLLGPGLSASAPPGWVVVPVPLADQLMGQLLRVGDRIDLYLPGGSGGGQVPTAALVSSGALVLALTPPAETGLLGAPSSSQASVIVVAVAGDDAAAVAGASSFGPFQAVLTASG